MAVAVQQPIVGRVVEAASADQAAVLQLALVAVAHKSPIVRMHMREEVARHLDRGVAGVAEDLAVALGVVDVVAHPVPVENPGLGRVHQLVDAAALLDAAQLLDAERLREAARQEHGGPDDEDQHAERRDDAAQAVVELQQVEHHHDEDRRHRNEQQRRRVAAPPCDREQTGRDGERVDRGDPLEQRQRVAVNARRRDEHDGAAERDQRDDAAHEPHGHGAGVR